MAKWKCEGWMAAQLGGFTGGETLRPKEHLLKNG